MKISEQCLERFNKNKTDFVHRFITVDETWIQQERSLHRRFGMLKAFCLLIESKAVTGEYYSNLLTRLDEKIREKRPSLRKGKKPSFIRTVHLHTKVFWQWED